MSCGMVGLRRVGTNARLRRGCSWRAAVLYLLAGGLGGARGWTGVQVSARQRHPSPPPLSPPPPVATPPRPPPRAEWPEMACGVPGWYRHRRHHAAAHVHIPYLPVYGKKKALLGGRHTSLYGSCCPVVRGHRLEEDTSLAGWSAGAKLPAPPAPHGGHPFAMHCGGVRRPPRSLIARTRKGDCGRRPLRLYHLHKGGSQSLAPVTIHCVAGGSNTCGRLSNGGLLRLSDEPKHDQKPIAGQP